MTKKTFEVVLGGLSESEARELKDENERFEFLMDYLDALDEANADLTNRCKSKARELERSQPIPRTVEWFDNGNDETVIFKPKPKNQRKTEFEIERRNSKATWDIYYHRN